MHRGLVRFLNVLFVILLFIPMLGMIAGIGITSPEAFRKLENRAPASFPNTEWTRAGLASLPEAVDQWFSDRFGFRRFLINLNARLDVQILRVSPDPERVVLGKKGWMFLGDLHEKVFSKHSGQVNVSEEDVRRFVEGRKKEKEWLARRGIQYVVVVTPDKHTVYPEYLPGWVRFPRPSAAADRAVELLSESGVGTIDVRSALISAKRDYGDILYHKTDTHWTDLGAYTAYVKVMEGLETLLGPLKRLKMKRFLAKQYNSGGDLSVMAGVDGHVHEHNVFMAFEQNFNAVSAYEISDLKPQKLVWEDPQRRVSRNLIAEINNTKALNPFRVVFLRDSFLTRLTHLFDQSFRLCVYTNPMYDQSLSMMDLVARYEPHIVVYQIAERMIPQFRHRPDEHAALGADVGS